MERLWVCERCDQVFEEPSIHAWVEWSEAHGVGMGHEVELKVCPWCGSPDIDLIEEEAGDDAEESPVEGQQLDPVPGGAGEPPGDPDGPSGQQGSYGGLRRENPESADEE